MAKALVHARSSARKFDGCADDYLAIHEKMDSVKAAHAEVTARCVFHSAWGIFLIEELFGRTLTNSEGDEVFVRDVAEQHVLEDLGFIPSLSDWLSEMPSRPQLAGAPHPEGRAAVRGEIVEVKRGRWLPSRPRAPTVLAALATMIVASCSEADPVPGSPSETPERHAAVDGPLAVELVSAEECRPFEVPHHGPVPIPGNVRVDGDRGSIVVSLDDVGGACDAPPSVRAHTAGDTIVVDIEPLAPGATPDRVRDLRWRIGGVPAGGWRVQIGPARTADGAGRGAYPVTVR